MIIRDLKRIALLAGPLLLILLLSASVWHSNPDYLRSGVHTLFGKNPKDTASWTSDGPRKPRLTPNETHYEIFSVSSSTGKFYEVRFGHPVFNPNIIPHNKFNDTWHIVGQLHKEATGNFLEDVQFHEVGCAAQFIEGTLMCIDFFQALPYDATNDAANSSLCDEKHQIQTVNVGPHDARVFYGPQNPFTVWGSNSAVTCFGQFIKDFRKMVDWEYEFLTNHDFQTATELVRPGELNQLEKNYFPFWDNKDVMHVHWDMWPSRGFARLFNNGTTGPNLSNITAAADGKCLKRYMPELPDNKLESIHQASNSLRITLCDRADPKCSPNAGNTYIMTIIQHKTFYGYHSEYEPYVVLFQQRSPFELYAISKKPLWISGRRRHKGRKTDMMYVTSINWKEKGLKYHGYLDDVIMMGFGYEDKYSGVLDVRAGDLLVDMGLCEDLPTKDKPKEKNDKEKEEKEKKEQEEELPEEHLE
ncbi:hypothetical protein VTJ04DRAFT_3925 [Mycothermus thermophilus]|uniref:uncharacterized protein n=1 Tax=Humicola insolens TaxID=85995 RepID=UPI003742DAEA